MTPIKNHSLRLRRYSATPLRISLTEREIMADLHFPAKRQEDARYDGTGPGRPGR